MVTVVRTEKRQRTAFGQVIKLVFIVFNALMLLWLVTGMDAVSQMTPDSGAARAGHAIGAAIGFSMILGIWMMGAVILGLSVLLTRGDKVIVEETAADTYADQSLGRELNTNGTHPDAVVARYKQRQQAESLGRAPSSPSSSPASFGRRR